MRYFAYGSNMSLARLQARVPSARHIGPAVLGGHLLRWHKIGSDGSGKCDALHTGDAHHQLPGVLFEIDPVHRKHLDVAEGLGHGYDAKWVDVRADCGADVGAFTYYALRIDVALQPYAWYKQHVLLGARESGLPPAHIHSIEGVGPVEDPDPERDRRERSIHD